MKYRNRKNPPKYQVVDQSTPSYKFIEIGVKEISKYLDEGDKVKGRSKRIIVATLLKTFNICDKKEKEAFIKAFIQVVSGNGNEMANILTLHSSALLALLLFYNVENNNITIGNVKYDQVRFEVKNAVLVDGYDCRTDNPSSVDVALYSTTSHALLLLEVKLTEPLTGGKCKFDSPKYLHWLQNKLSKLELEQIGLAGSVLQKTDSKGRLLYNGGIKQLTAHYIGAINGPKSITAFPEEEDYRNWYESAETINLAMFTLPQESAIFDTENEKSKMTDYINHVIKLAKIISKNKTDRAKFCDNAVLFPNDLKFDKPIKDTICEFYCL